jgi:hypothetical protein
MSRIVWPWVLECHGQQAALAGVDLQDPQSGLAGIGGVAQIRDQVHAASSATHPGRRARLASSSMLAAHAWRQLRHCTGASAGGADVALAAARLRKATAQPKVSSTVRSAKYAS